VKEHWLKRPDGSVHTVSFDTDATSRADGSVVFIEANSVAWWRSSISSGFKLNVGEIFPLKMACFTDDSSWFEGIDTTKDAAVPASTTREICSANTGNRRSSFYFEDVFAV
jgi:hypothetical protein